MARRKKRGGRGFRVGKWVNLAFKGIGGAIALGPAIRAVQLNWSSPQVIPAGLSYEYIGYNPNTGVFDSSVAFRGIGSVVGGLLVAKLGGILARRM